MRKTISTLIMLGGLSGCGGEDDAASGDKGAPTVTLTAPATAESGIIVPLSIVVTDDKDQGLQATLSCTGGAMTGTLLTLPVVTSDTTVECTATATDSDGKVGTAKATIKVTPATASLNSYTSAEQVIPAGGMGILFAQNLALDQAEYQGTLNGTPVALHRVNGNELIYFLPPDMPPGTGDFSIKIGSRLVTIPVTVGAPPPVPDARNQVAAFIQNAQQQVEAALANPNISDAAREELEKSLPQLNTALTTMPNASDVEVSQLASRLAALGLIGSSTLRALSYDPIQTGPTCSSDRDEFAINLAGLVVGSILVIEGTNSAIAGALIPGAGWASAVGSGLAIGAGVVILQKVGPHVNRSRKAFWNSCWTEMSINAVPFNADDFTSVRRTAAITLPGKPSFRPKKARSFKLERVYAPSDPVRLQARQYFEDVGKVLAAVSFLPDTVAQALQDYKVEGSETVPAGRMSLSGISSGKVSGSASASDDVITLTFDTTAKAADLTDGKLPFSFNLLRQGEETVIINAEMSLALPEALDAAVEVVQGESIASSVQTIGAETLAVTSRSAHGAVSLSDSGDFTYRPSGTFFGRDMFKYVARNADGESEEATVVVDVVRKFEGTWDVAVQSTTTSESSPGLCPAESSEFSASVSKISDTKYSTVYAGYELIMTMSGKDDPNGPSGTKAYVDDDEDETERGNVSISIPDSQTLRGSNSWSWTGPDGKSCSGSTKITGTR